jgi:hypothetical protein
MTDSNGYFEFQFLVPDTYSLFLNYGGDTIISNIIVKAGEVTDVGLIIPDVYNGSSIYYYNLSVDFKTDSSHYYEFRVPRFYSSYEDDDIDTQFIYADYIFFHVRAWDPNPDGFEVPFILKVDGQQVFASKTVKLRSYFTISADTGLHLYEFYFDTVKTNAVYICNLNFPGNFFSIEVYDKSNRNPDLDLFIVNENGDTCSYRKLKPDWGVTGNIFDDPIHYGDENSMYSSDLEKIVYAIAPSGNYEVFVHSFLDTNRSNLSFDNFLALPEVKIIFNDSVITEVLGDTLRVGQLWHVGTVKVPSMVFEKNGSVSEVWYP